MNKSVQQIPKSTFRRLKRKKKVEEPSKPKRYPDLDDLFSQMHAIKERGRADAPLYQDLERQAIDLMTKYGLDEEGYAGRTLVSSSVTELNVEQLKRKLNDRQWEMITRRQFDKDMLTAAIQRGFISKEIVRQCTVDVPRKSYIRGN